MSALVAQGNSLLPRSGSTGPSLPRSPSGSSGLSLPRSASATGKGTLGRSPSYVAAQSTTTRCESAAELHLTSDGERVAVLSHPIREAAPSGILANLLSKLHLHKKAPGAGLRVRTKSKASSCWEAPVATSGDVSPKKEATVRLKKAAAVPL